MRNHQEIFQKILIQRGLENPGERDEFLSEKPQKTYDPFLLLDMEAGVDFLLEAIEKKEKLCIYGDYDADGVTSVALLYEVLSSLHDNLIYYIPSRIEEGYGLNGQAMEYLRQQGVDKIVTVDCGSSSYGEVVLAQELGMDVLITDHHQPGIQKPPCAMINPRQKNCAYPNPHLAGCGVAFKLAQALAQRTDLNKDKIRNVLDLVAIGTIGDVMPLLDENRTLVKYGLYKIAKGNRRGLVSLMKRMGVEAKTITSTNVAFSLVPPINAAGRMTQAQLGTQLLLERDQEQAQILAEKLVQCNEQRKEIQGELVQRCLKTYEEDHREDLFPLIYTKEAHEGIIGIVAGTLKDKVKKPIAIVTEGRQGLKGTARTYGQLDLHGVLKKSESLFLKFGGHKGACGFSMEKEQLPSLQRAMNQEVRGALQRNPEVLEPLSSPQEPLEAGEVTRELCQLLRQLEPFGMNNEEPLFLLRNMTIKQGVIVGKDRNHIRFQGVFPTGESISCILFQKVEDYRRELFGKFPVDIYGTLNENRYRGRETVQMIVSGLIGKDKSDES